MLKVLRSELRAANRAARAKALAGKIRESIWMDRVLFARCELATFKARIRPLRVRRAIAKMKTAMRRHAKSSQKCFHDSLVRIHIRFVLNFEPQPFKRPHDSQLNFCMLEGTVIV